MCSERPHSSTSERRGSSRWSAVSGGSRIGTMAVEARTFRSVDRGGGTGPSYRPAGRLGRGRSGPFGAVRGRVRAQAWERARCSTTPRSIRPPSSGVSDRARSVMVEAPPATRTAPKARAERPLATG